jgi:hypothetical protein
MEPNFTWYDLDHPEPDIGHGVLELHERLTPPAQALELHVVMTRASTRSDGGVVGAGWRTGRRWGSWRWGRRNSSCSR